MVLLLAAAGCASRGQQVPVEPLLRHPLPVESLGGPLSLSQVVTTRYQGERHSLRVETEIAENGLVMVGLSHIGVPLFEMTLKGEAVETRSLGQELLPFDPRYILSDFQLAYWPFDQVAAALSRAGYALKRGEANDERLVYDGKKTLVARVYHLRRDERAGVMMIEHHDLPYQIEIETLERGEAG